MIRLCGSNFGLLSFFIRALPVILYFTLQESSPRRATWGKRRANIKVVAADGGRVGFWRALLRSALKFLPWQLAHACVIHLFLGGAGDIYQIGAFAAEAWALVYLASLWLNKKRQTPYDWVAGTVVVSVG